MGVGGWVGDPTTEVVDCCPRNGTVLIFKEVKLASGVPYTKWIRRVGGRCRNHTNLYNSDTYLRILLPAPFTIQITENAYTIRNTTLDMPENKKTNKSSPANNVTDSHRNEPRNRSRTDG